MIHDARTCREIEATTDSDDRSTPSFDQPRIEAAVREILLAIGEDPDREGLLDTPSRVARAYGEMFGGLDQSPAAHLARQFPQDGSDPVMVTDIPFTS
ncbi:MAG: GTP cyclohydrolase I FolE, partial [Phycisphaeraceae bacterium]|nr:GTP cyclohydrolase I FolE [Phycisphaeraceae bacterium]